MHAQVEFDRWQLQARYKAMPVATRRELQERAPLLDVPLDETLDDKFSIPYTWSTEHLIDLTTTGVVLTEHEITFTIRRFKSMYKIEAAAGVHTTVNLQVAIPNLLLWSVDEIDVMEDACTYALQSKIDAGWRILAICPPACQRRPDYIIGRQKPKA